MLCRSVFSEKLLYSTREMEEGTGMNQLATYPLHVALEVSPQWGATLEKGEVWVRVVPFLRWQVSVYRGGHEEPAQHE